MYIGRLRSFASMPLLCSRLSSTTFLGHSAPGNLPSFRQVTRTLARERHISWNIGSSYEIAKLRVTCLMPLAMLYLLSWFEIVSSSDVTHREIYLFCCYNFDLIYSHAYTHNTRMRAREVTFKINIIYICNKRILYNIVVNKKKMILRFLFFTK